MGVGGSPPSHYLTWEQFGHIDLWSTETGQPLRRLAHFGDVTQLAFSPDGKLLAAVGLYTPGDSLNANGVRVFAPNTGTTIHSFGRGQAFAFSPNGKDIVVSDDFRTAQYRVGTWEKQKVFASLKGDVQSLAFSPDGRVLAAVVVNREGTRLRTVDVDSGKLLNTTGPLDLFYRMVFSPMGRWLATGEQGRVRLWEANSLEQVQSLAIEGGELIHPFFSPAGDLIGGAGQTSPSIVIWHTASGQARTISFENGGLDTVYARFRGTRVRPELAPARVRFSPDGRSLAAGYDHGILVDARTGELQYRLPSDGIKRPEVTEENLYAKHLAAAGIATDKVGIQTFLHSLIPTKGHREDGEELLRKLGAENFAEREAASKELRQRVHEFLPLLRRSAKRSADPEIAQSGPPHFEKSRRPTAGECFLRLRAHRAGSASGGAVAAAGDGDIARGPLLVALGARSPAGRRST